VDLWLNLVCHRISVSGVQKVKIHRVCVCVCVHKVNHIYIYYY